MSGPRCPSCGGLVAEDAEWCGQCLAPLDRPSPAPAQPQEPAAKPPRLPAAGNGGGSPTGGAVPGAGGGEVRVEGERVLWTCPTCDAENPLEAGVCTACGTPFRRLFEEPEAPRTTHPGRAVALSLAFPGAGHVAAGRVAEGMARAVVFAYAVGTGVAMLAARGGVGAGPFLPLVALSFAVAAGLYAVSAVDAARAARGEPALLTSRMLLYGAAGLILLTVAVLVVSGLRATGG